MKRKAYTLLALLAMVLGMVACSERAPLAPVATPNPADITLVPYTSEEMGIRGVMPKGWVDVKRFRHDTVLDVLANNDKDPVREYHAEAKEICEKLIVYLNSN